MPSWLIKAGTQRAIGFLPSPHVWNNALQEGVWHTVTLDPARFEDKLGRARDHMAALCSATGAARAARVVEIGTGWFPVAALAFWLCGAREVHTLDRTRHLTPARLAATVGQFARAHRDGRLARLLPEAAPDRIRCLEGLSGAIAPERLAAEMDRLGLRYRVGASTLSGMPDGAADLVFSTAVLEYVPYPELVDLLRDCARILARGGCTSHWIDLADEYAYFDRAITPFNFLRFSDRTWRLINNPIIPLTRLRIGDYRRAFAEAGLAVTGEQARRGAIEDLARVPLAAAFRPVPLEDLLVLDALVAAVPDGDRH